MVLIHGALLAVALVACTKTNPNYCAGAPLHNCALLDSGSGSDGSGCTTNAACAPMVCDTQMHACVACTADDTAACTGTAPACVNDACTGCTIDAQCASGVCRADGSCADEAATLYATVTAPGGSACTKTDKCTLTAALAKLSTTATVIHLDPGTYTDALALTKDAVLVGRGAIIERSSGAVATVANSKNVAFEELVLRAATTSNGVNGVSIGSSALVTISGCEVGPTEGIGIAMASGGSLVIARSTIHDNLLGGLQVGGSTTSSLLDVTNTMIYVNGGAAISQNIGGISIAGGLLGGSRIDYVTVVDNGANNNASAHSGGIVCDLSTFAITNSIIARNTVGNNPGAANANTFGMCTATAGDIVQPALDGLAMRDPTNHDYHLTTGSTAEGHASATSITVDIDGDTRPQGTGYDSGADELAP